MDKINIVIEAELRMRKINNSPLKDVETEKAYLKDMYWLDDYWRTGQVVFQNITEPLIDINKLDEDSDIVLSTAKQFVNNRNYHISNHNQHMLGIEVEDGIAIIKVLFSDYSTFIKNFIPENPNFGNEYKLITNINIDNSENSDGEMVTGQGLYSINNILEYERSNANNSGVVIHKRNGYCDIWITSSPDNYYKDLDEIALKLSK